MAGGIEVGSVVGTLEVLASEGFVAHLDGTLGSVVPEEGDAVAAADASYGLADRFEACPLAVPGGDVADACVGTALADVVDEELEAVAEHGEGVAAGTNLVGIVVSADDEDIVGLRVKEVGLGPEGGSEVPALTGVARVEVVCAVEGHAGSVLAQVVVSKAELLCHLAMPGLLLGALVVLHVGVADDVERLGRRAETEGEEE